MIAWLGAVKYIMGWVMTELLYDCTAGVHATEYSSLVLSIVCASTCTAIGILCHEIPCVWYAHEHAWDVQRREICASLSLIQPWRLWRLPHIPSISLSCVSCIVCVFIYSVRIQPAVLGRWGVGKLSYSIITAQSNSVYFTHKYSSTRFRVTYTINCYTDDVPPLIDNEKIVTVFILSLLFKFSDML
jgi:hypothetical protein